MFGHLAWLTSIVFCAANGMRPLLIAAAAFFLLESYAASACGLEDGEDRFDGTICRPFSSIGLARLDDRRNMAGVRTARVNDGRTKNHRHPERYRR